MPGVIGHRRSFSAAARILGTALLLHGLAPVFVVTDRAVSAQEEIIPLDTLHIHVGSRVSSAIPALTRSIQLLSRETIEALPARTISDLLEMATGVDVMSRSPAQSDLSLRGAGFEQVVVLVNGVRMSDPQTGHFDLDLVVPLDQVERVEILRGSASALYGADAVGGVVNVVTRGGGLGLNVRGEGGTWETARLSVGGGLGEPTGVAVQGGGEVSRSDGHRTGTDYEIALAHASGRAPIAGGHAVLEVGYARRDFGARDFYAPFPSFEKTRTRTSSLRWGASGVDLGLSYRSHDDEFILIRDDPSAFTNQHTSSQAGGEVLIRGGEMQGLNLAVGAEVYRDILESNNLGDHRETRWAIFGEAVVGRGGPGALTLGLREDWHEGFGTFISPSLSAAYSFRETVRVRAAAGRSFRAPTWTERYYSDPVNVGREDLDPEQAWSVEAGADLLRSSVRRLSITGFVRRATDLIDWARLRADGEDVPWETRNVEEATFRGLEMDLAFAGPLGTSFSAGGMILSLSSEEAPGYRSKYALRPLKERINVGLSRTFHTGLAVNVRAQRGKREGEDLYHRVDLRTGYDFGSMTLYLDANNLFDAEYPDVTGARAPGRAFFMGLDVGTGSH